MLRAILEIIQIGIKQYGALFAVVGFVCFVFWYILKHTINESVNREKEQRKIINSSIKELKLQRRQRHRDHGQITKSLDGVVEAIGRVNGYKK